MMKTLIIILLSLAPVSVIEAQSHSHGTATHKKAAARTPGQYVCPMHADVRSGKKGKCPKCGMALRLAKNERPNAETSAMSGEQPSVKMEIPDVEVLDQDGNKLRFYTDLVKGKTVAINFIFTTCTTICPPLGATFARVQKLLAEQSRREVQLISISVDPVTDTPQRLKAWGDKFNAGPGWTFITGKKPEIDKLLNALAASVVRRENHSPVVIIGNDTKSQWVRTYGLANPSTLTDVIHKVERNGDDRLSKGMQ
jgi:cytochrome oxidase Cu insertion factor (SCO1/SenC/PrrC family)